MEPRPSPAASAADSGPSPVPRPQRRSRVGLWLLGLAVAAVVVLALLTAWGLRSETGTRWLLRAVPGMDVGGTEGALLGSQFAAQDLQWRDPISGHRLSLDSLTVQDIAWTWRPGSGVWLGWDVGLVKLGSLTWTSGKPSAERLKPPGTLRLPFEIAVHRLQMDALSIDAQTPIENLQAQLHLGANAGSEHQFQVLQATARTITFKGAGNLQTDAPFGTQVLLQAESSHDVAWTAKTELRGPLSSLDLQMELAAEPSRQGNPARLDARARLQPFEIWPLGDVALSTQDLDLAALLPDAPQTKLSGHATIRSTGSRDPVEVDIRLDNAKPGRLDEGGLPVLSVNLVVKGQPAQPGQLDIGPFTVDVADRQGAAGRWVGSGRWTDGQVQLTTRLTDLQPSRLDSRLAPMRLNGSWDLSLRGLPSPDPAQWNQASPVNLRALQFTAKAQLQGQVVGAPAEVQLAFEASGDSEQLRIRELMARSGAAQLRLDAEWQRQASQRWQLRSTGDLQAFDPRIWFPGDEATWGTGQHRINGQWNLDVLAPALDRSTRWAQWLPAVLGRVDLKITPSQLVGLPFQADLTLRQNARSGAQSGAQDAPSQARADIRLGAAHLQLSGSGDASDRGDNDRTRVQLNVPSLAELAPLAGLRSEWQPWAPRRGELQLQADLVGRWPQLSGQANLSANQILAGPLSLAKGELKAQRVRAAEEDFQLSAQADDLIWQGASIKSVQAQLRGSLAQHSLSLNVTAPVIPPAPVAQALGWRPSGLARAELMGTGTWSAGPGDSGDAAVAGRWAGRIERLTAGEVQANAAGAGGSTDNAWLSVADARVETHWTTSGQLQRGLLEPGLARSGPLTLRWKEALWQRGISDAQSTWRWRGEIDPFVVAPLLQRLQAQGDTQRTQVASAGTMSPAWSGDLSLGVQADIRAEDRFAADIRIRRERGDLSAVDGNQLTPLDLETVDLRLQAQDGVWRFQPQMEGRRWGRLGGEVIARTRASDRWPRPGATLQGRMDARVATLATWSRWLAPGWGLQGELDASASLSGTWAAPAYTGQLNGERIAVRNPLQGVDLRDGRLQVRLEGETARIETLSIRGGDGQLTAEGQARFGQKPEVQLVATAQRLRVLGRVDRQLVVSGQTRLTLDPNQLSLQGRVAADSGFFDLSSRDAPSLDEDVVVLRPGTTATASAPGTQPSAWSGKTRIALDLDLGQNLRLQGRGLQTGLAGQLRLTTPEGRPNYQGSVQAVNGSYAAYGQRLRIDRGQINFNGALDRARLDILALRPNLDVRVGVVITGSATDPRVRLFSEPDMSESDKLSWLVLGRSPEGLGTTDTALLQRAAMALLAGEGESASEVALRKLGLDEFSIRQSDGEVRETVVSVGKQLGRRWYVGYERGVNATAGTWQLVYRAAQRFTLRAQSGSDSSLDVIWTWRFGQP